MYDDVEADFWKEIFVHMQHKNMIRTNGEALFKEQYKKLFDEFEKKYPDYPSQITDSASYLSWEIFITPTVKLRLYIQNQIKASLLQVNNGDLVKIADAKFPYNPLPEIEELLQNKEKYRSQLIEKTDSNIKFLKQQKLTGEIIKALLKNKFNGEKMNWYLEPSKTDFVLTIVKNGEEIKKTIHMKSFKEDISEL